MMEVQLEINGQSVSVREGATVMEAINKIGAYVPHFCYHEKLSVAANCRMCMVDIKKSPRPLPACATPVADGMVVRTDSEAAKKAQRSVMEFLLINHPLDCPICDQGGECQLQDLAVGYGVSSSRYAEEKRVVFEKQLGPLIATDMTRCIHCTRCVRFGREVAGVMELGMVGRGEHAEIMPFIERTVDSELSGNMIDVCPVGALTSKPFRYSARPWELTPHAVIAAHDSWGSHVTAQVKGGAIKRVLPRRAPDIHEHWISDRDRFSYQGLTAADRAAAPMMREPGGRLLQETNWRRALERLTTDLRGAIKQHGADKVGFFVSPRATCEEAALLAKIARHLGCRNIDSRLAQRDFAGADISGLGASFAEIKKMSAALFVGAEPARELPLLAAHLRQRAARKTYLSVSPADIGDNLPMHQQLLAAPEKLAQLMTRLAVAAGGKPPAGWDANNQLALPDMHGAVDEAPVRQAVKTLSARAGKGVIWLGDIARMAPQYGVIKEMAKRLAAQLNFRIGVLDDGANGIGARRAGALPYGDGMNTAAMLRAGLRAVVLFRCEADDFGEAALAARMLREADFVAAITSFTGIGGGGADVVLPAAEFGESEGSYINGYEVAERFAAACPPPKQARPAWKILRLLGEMFAAPGFDFADLAAARAGVLAAADGEGEGKEEREEAAYVEPPSRGRETTYSRAGGFPLYGGDMLARRADALQKTRQGKRAAVCGMHADDMADAGVAEGGAVVIGDGDTEWQTTACADKTLTRGVLRFWSPVLAGGEGLTLRAAAAEKTA